MDLAKQLEGFIDATEDDCLLMELIQGELNIKALEKNHYKKYFRNDVKRAWGFKCYHCGGNVKSDEAEAYYIVSITWKVSNTRGNRFCTNDCSNVYYNREMKMMLKKRKQLLEAREQIRK
ncbi:hypothetical protein NSQ62_17105 [Solibacillus sp. FSL H8-0523]|uniref:hypothetical protein n=1 Tax=Solibacillus sp. FSL H8-0523 TaxID=2954511 RepID=UPI00310122EE